MTKSSNNDVSSTLNMLRKIQHKNSQSVAEIIFYKRNDPNTFGLINLSRTYRADTMVNFEGKVADISDWSP